MLIVQIKPSAAKTLTLRAPSAQDMVPSPGKRLLGILSPGLVPSMDYSISLRALDHTELYLDSQNESSNLQEDVGGCTPPATCRCPPGTMAPTHGTDWGSSQMSQQSRRRLEGTAGESPALSLWQWEALLSLQALQSPSPSSSFTIPLRGCHPTDQLQCLPAPWRDP